MHEDSQKQPLPCRSEAVGSGKVSSSRQARRLACSSAVHNWFCLAFPAAFRLRLLSKHISESTQQRDGHHGIDVPTEGCVNAATNPQEVRVHIHRRSEAFYPRTAASSSATIQHRCQLQIRVPSRRRYDQSRSGATFSNQRANTAGEDGRLSSHPRYNQSRSGAIINEENSRTASQEHSPDPQDDSRHLGRQREEKEVTDFLEPSS